MTSLAATPSPPSRRAALHGAGRTFANEYEQAYVHELDRLATQVRHHRSPVQGVAGGGGEGLRFYVASN